MAKLDHIMYATPDLQRGIEEIADLTGVEAVYGGAHPGNGTCNALLSFGPDQYLEIIAPDPDQTLTDTLGEELIEHGGSGVRAWAVATANLENVAAVARDNALATRPIVDMNRTTPDGVRLDWQLCFVTGIPLLPFFIDWKQSPHPAANTPGGCSLAEFTVTLPDTTAFQAFADALEIDVTVHSGPEAFGARLQTRSGIVELGNW